MQPDSTGSSHGSLTQLRKLENNICIMSSIFYSLIIWLSNIIVKLSLIVTFVIASTQWYFQKTSENNRAKLPLITIFGYTSQLMSWNLLMRIYVSNHFY